jgi:hypothetical protein
MGQDVTQCRKVYRDLRTPQTRFRWVTERKKPEFYVMKRCLLVAITCYTEYTVRLLIALLHCCCLETPLTAEGAPHGFQCCSEFSIPMAYSVCSFLPMSFHSKRQNSKRARILKSNAPSSATLFLSFFLSFHFSGNILF